MRPVRRDKIVADVVIPEALPFATADDNTSALHSRSFVRIAEV